MKIKVCTGNTCGEKFSKYIVSRLENDILFHKQKNINIEKTLCMGNCKKGPNIIIENEKYDYATPIKASELVCKKYNQTKNTTPKKKK